MQEAAAVLVAIYIKPITVLTILHMLLRLDLAAQEELALLLAQVVAIVLSGQLKLLAGVVVEPIQV